MQSIKKESACVEKIISDLTELGVVFPSKVNSVENIIQSLKHATDGNNYALDWLNGEEQKLTQSEQRSRTPLQVFAEEVVMVDISLSKINNSCLRDDNERALVRAWCNEVFVLKEYNGKVSTFAESLSDEVTRKAKVVYGDSWEESYSKSVLNQMRRYVRAQESNISWQDDLFSSITAVIAKGSDWEQLRKFMQSKMISDYKIAFAFFGELNGFANLTRDFTDVLFAHKDRNYVASVYKEIYGQLHGEDPSLGNENIILVDNRARSNDKDSIYNANDSLRAKVEAIIKAHPKTSLSEKDKEIINRTLNTVQDELSFIAMICKEVGNPKSGIFKYIKKELKPKKEETKIEKPIDKKRTPMEASLFGHIINGMSKLLESDSTDRKASNSIINDTNAVKILNSCPILPYDLKAQIVDIFIDFQRSYQSGYYFEHQNQYKRNNSDVIDHFIKFCLSKKNNRAIKWSPENSKLMDELKKYLMKFYAN